MSTRRSKSSGDGLPRPTLEDVHGPWCAWCLEYFSECERPHKHHFYGKWGFSRMPKVYPTEFDWVVPVHKTTCHKELQLRCDAAVVSLIHHIATESSPDKLAQYANSSFLQGNINVSLACHLRAALLCQTQGNPAEMLHHYRNAFAVGAGSRPGALFLAGNFDRVNAVQCADTERGSLLN